MNRAPAWKNLQWRESRFSRCTYACLLDSVRLPLPFQFVNRLLRIVINAILIIIVVVIIVIIVNVSFCLFLPVQPTHLALRKCLPVALAATARRTTFSPFFSPSSPSAFCSSLNDRRLKFLREYENGACRFSSTTVNRISFRQSYPELCRNN